MIELRIALQPKQHLLRESIERFPVTLYGGAKGGGKSHGLRNIFLLRRFQYPKSIGKIFRRTYPELEDNHISPLFRQFPDLREYWSESKKKLSLPNGSELQFCYCKNESDVDHYQGRETHDLGIDEASQWTEAMITRLRGSNRSSDPNIPARTALTANPGGLAHTFLKRVFVKRYFNERERPQDYNFIQALVDDNPALIENDPDYVHRLNTEPNSALRKAYRYGDWDIFAGQFFGEIDRSIHLIDPFEIPTHWSKEGAYDYGFSHPAAFGWFAGDGDGNAYMYREFVKAGLRVDEYVAELKKYKDTETLQKITAGLDAWATRNSTINKQQGPKPPTVAEEFATHGLQLTRANVDRIQGANQVRNYLAWKNKPKNKPKLFIFKNCPITFDTIARMQTNPDRMEDVLKIDSSNGDADTGDDAYDMIRYYLMSRPLLADPPPPPRRGSPEWQIAEAERMREETYRMVKEEQDALKTWSYEQYY